MLVKLFQPIGLKGTTGEDAYEGLISKVLDTEYFPKEGDIIKDPFFDEEKTVNRIILSSDAAGKCCYEVHLESFSGNYDSYAFSKRIMSSKDCGWLPEDPFLKGEFK